MNKTNSHTFDCQIYVPAGGLMTFRLPRETGPRQIITLRPIAYDELVDPNFRRLLAAFDAAPRTLLATSTA